MSATVAAALKKVAVAILTNKKLRRTFFGIILGIILILVMPIVAIVSILNGNIEIDTDRLQTLVVENLSEEEKAKLQKVEDTMYGIEDKMTEAGYESSQTLSAQVLYVTVLSDYANDSGFIDKLVGCYAKDQTDAQLVNKVNSAFGTQLKVEEFTQFMNSVHKKIVSVALKEVGNKGGEPYWKWYGFDSRVEWCACFVSWCADQAGYIDSGLIPKFSGCTNGVEWFKNHDQWLDGKETPSSGMIIFFDWENKGNSGPQDGDADHVGIVEKVENGIVYTIEGNAGDECKRLQYKVGHSEILGYGTYTLRTQKAKE